MSSGLPIPNTVHGYEPQAEDFSKLRFLGHFDAALVGKPGSLPFALGAWGSGNLAVVEVLRVNAWTLSAAIGPCIAATFGPWTRVGLVASVVAGPGMLGNWIELDERVNKATLSIGWRGAAGVTAAIWRGWHLGVRLGREDYAAPFYGNVWFNQPLTATALWTATVAVDWHSP